MSIGRSALVSAAAICLFLFLSCRQHHASRSLIVLGIDGMDPGFVERHWDSLPNLAKLRHDGSFSRLATTTPPQSPVAWSSFITGLAPAEHGLFDFVLRDPHTLQPFSSMSRTEPPRWSLPIGTYLLPLSSTRVVSLRHGTPFWQTLCDRGIPVTVVHMPTNYPPVKAGQALAGMGTPDLRGTLGTFTFYTDDPEELTRPVSGGRIVTIHLEQGHAVLPLEGPPNSLRRSTSGNRVLPYATTNLVVDVDQSAAAARLVLGEQVVILREGEWSTWIPVDFSLIPHLSSVRGMVRVFAKQLRSGFGVYVSPVNIDPISPALPVAAPADWGTTIARDISRFSTLGIPEDTSALRQQIFSLSDFRMQTLLVFDEERRLLRYSLHHFQNGLLFFYISSIDQNSHMLWGRHESELLGVYQAIDQLIGEIRHSFSSVPLVILSDHGFASFERAVHLNTWLKNRGFLSPSNPGDSNSGLAAINWQKTEAYAIGLNGLYLNQKDREAHGVVASGAQRNAVLAKLREELFNWRDPVGNRQIVKTVYEEKPSAQNAAVAPDLIVGYSPGYRASWQTALGQTPTLEIEDNADAWIADHCINPADVPGVFFASWPLRDKPPGIQDLPRLIVPFFH